MWTLWMLGTPYQCQCLPAQPPTELWTASFVEQAAMSKTPAFAVGSGGRIAQAAAAGLLSRSGRWVSSWPGSRGHVASAFHDPAAASAAPAARLPHPLGARLVSSRSPPTMGLQKVKLGGSDLEVTQVCLGTMTWGIQNTEDEAYVHFVRRSVTSACSLSVRATWAVSFGYRLLSLDDGRVLFYCRGCRS